MADEILSTIVPDQAVVDYTDEQYMTSMRWIISQYNKSLNNLPTISARGTTTTGISTFVQEYFNNLQYKTGTQIPADYAFFVSDSSGNNTQVPMVRGLDVMKVTNYLNGKTIELIEPLPETSVAKSYSSGALSAKKNMQDYAYFQIKHQNLLKLIEQESGFGFKAVDRDFKSQDEIDRFFEDFSDGMEIAFDYMAKDVMYSNDYLQTFVKGGDYAMFSGLASIRVDYENGKPILKLIPPERAIVDWNKLFDVHRNDDFGGDVEMLSIPEVFSRWDFTLEEQSELKAMAENMNNVYSAYYVPLMNGLSWFNTTSDGVRRVLVAKGQWESLEKVDGQWKKVKREATLIANKFLRDQMKSLGQLKRLKYIQWTPGLMVGTNSSIVGTTKRFQDMKDAFLTKATTMAANSMKAVIIRTGKLPPGMATPEYISQLKNNGVIVDEGEIDELNDGKSAVEVIDLSIDPGIQYILQMAQFYQNEMADFTDTSPIVRGQQDNYQSQGAIGNIQAQSAKGRAFYFKGMLKWVQETVTYAANLYKTLAPDDDLGREHLEMLIGSDRTALLSMDTVRGMQFEDFLFTFKVDDFVGENDKRDLINLVTQTAGNPLARKTIRDYIKLKKLGTLTQMDEYMSVELYKDQMREDEQIKAQQEAAAANAKMVSDANVQNVQQQVQVTEKLAYDANETKKLIAESKNQTDILLKKMEDEQKAQDSQLKLLLEDRALDLEEKRINAEEKRSKEDTKKESKK